MKKVKILSLLLFATLFSTCTNDVYNPDVCFQETVLPIFITNCSMVGCHNSIDYAEEYDFTNYDGILKGVTPKHPTLSPVYRSISGKFPEMPVDGKLTNEEISKIKIWIKMGAKNSSNCNAQICDTSNITFSKSIKPIIDKWCVSCHNSSLNSGNYDFSTYSGIKLAITNGRFLGAIKHDSGYSPMPSFNTKISDCEISILESWLNSGAQNN